MKRELLTISTYQAFPSNAWVLATIIDGHLVTRTYMGGSKREALQWFKRELNITERLP